MQLLLATDPGWKVFRFSETSKGEDMLLEQTGSHVAGKLGLNR